MSPYEKGTPWKISSDAFFFENKACGKKLSGIFLGFLYYGNTCLMIELPFLASKPFSRVLDYSQKNHCNDNCNDFSDYNDIIALLDKLIINCITLFSGVQ